MAGEPTFSVWQDGMPVATVSSPNRATAEYEISHYAFIYAQDGPVEVREGRKRRPDLKPSDAR